jgi:hypothetical protein
MQSQTFFFSTGFAVFKLQRSLCITRITPP